MIQLNCPMTLGMALGTTATNSLVSEINDELGGSSFFDNMTDILNKGRQVFIDNRIKPIREIARNIIKDKISIFNVADKIVIIDDEKKLEAVPLCMQGPIMAYEPIRKLFEQNRIYGFGFEEVPTEDPWGRLINNGRVVDIGEAMSKDGYVTFEYEWRSTDPVVTIDELDCIELTREWIDTFLESSQIDPTDYPNLRG